MEVNVPADRIRLLDYKEGEYSTISVVEDKENRARTIYLDGFSTATVYTRFPAVLICRPWDLCQWRCIPLLKSVFW